MKLDIAVCLAKRSLFFYILFKGHLHVKQF